MDNIYPECKNHGFSLKTNLDASKKIIDYLFRLVTAHEKNNLLDANIIVLKIIKILVEKFNC